MYFLLKKTKNPRNLCAIKNTKVEMKGLVTSFEVCHIPFIRISITYLTSLNLILLIYNGGTNFKITDESSLASKL
jgi:hypothetical protein